MKNKRMVLLAIVAMIMLGSCSMGLRWDNAGEVEGYVNSPKINLEDSK